VKERFKFTLVEIAPLEESLRLTPEERLARNNAMANRLIRLEAFMETIYRGWNFINSYHVNPRQTRQ
jgi:hypothetical protein